MKKQLFILMATWSLFVFTQHVVLIDPQGDGGFELGNNFPSNGWTVVNGSQTNYWIIGTNAGSPYGSAAFITNNGSDNAYNTSATSVVHFYRDITFPAGFTDIQLTFWIRGYGESTFDRLRVYLVDPSTTPVAGTELTTGQIGLPNYNLQPAWIKVGIPIPSTFAGTTRRLVFSWRNDNSLGTQPPIAIDNISLIAQIPISFNGSYTIDRNLPAGGGNFSSIIDAILSLNAGTITGNSSFYIQDGQTFTEILPPITNSHPTFSVTFTSSSTLPAKILSGGFSGTTDAIISLVGADNITISNLELGYLTLSESSIEYGIGITNASATNGAQKNTFSNLKITLNRSNTSSRGVYQNVAVTPTSAAGANSNNIYSQISIQNSYHGIQCTGNSTYPDLNTLIENCTIGATISSDIGNGTSAVNGIRLTSQSGFIVRKNTIRNLNVTGGSNVFAIYAENAAGNNLIEGNYVYNISSTSTSTSAVLHGIRVDGVAGSSTNVQNNLIYGFSHAISTPSTTIVARGLSANVGTTTGTVNFYHNTVHLDMNAASSNTALALNNGTVRVVNNIFSNLSATNSGSKRYLIYRSGGTLTSNYNDLYIPVGTNNFVGYFTADRATLLDWQTASGQDANSFNTDPLYTSLFPGNYNFRPMNPDIDNKGTSSLGITTDIEDQPRSPTNPDLGAYEFNAPTCLRPTSINVSNITTSTADVSWVGTSTDYQVSYGLSPITPAYGNKIYVFNSSTTTLTGLQHSSFYDVYVRSICGPGDTSIWFGPLTFQTACGVFNLPYLQFIPTSSWPLCFTQTPLSGDRWNVNNTSNAGGTPYEFRCSYVNASGTSRLISPSLDLSSANHPYLSFRHFLDDYSYTSTATLKIQSSSDNGNTWVDEAILYVAGNGQNRGPEILYIPLTNISPNTKVAWTITGHHYAFDYWYVDNIRIFDAVFPTVNPNPFIYSHLLPTHATTSITWNDATQLKYVINLSANDTLAPNTEFTLIGSQLTILNSYLQNYLPSLNDTINFLLVFNVGTANFMVVDQPVYATINPSFGYFRLGIPQNVGTQITWNQENMITSIVNIVTNDTLQANLDYILSSDFLEFQASYISANIEFRDTLKLRIKFNESISNFYIIDTSLTPEVYPNTYYFKFVNPLPVYFNFNPNDATNIDYIINLTDNDTLEHNVDYEYTVNNYTNWGYVLIYHNYLSNYLTYPNDSLILRVKFNIGYFDIKIVDNTTFASIYPTVRNFSLAYPQNLFFQINLNDELYLHRIINTTNNDTLMLYHDYLVSGTTLYIFASYISSRIQAGGQLNLSVKFSTSTSNITINEVSILPYIYPDQAYYNISVLNNVKSRIIWNDASYVLKVKNLSNNSFLQDPDFDVIGDTLFINASYLSSIFTSSGQTKAFEITFNIGKDTLFITSKQSPYIDPNPMVYYYQIPSELRGKIFWNDASSITSIHENPSNPLVLNQHYKISNDTLIFLPSYLTSRFTGVDTAHLTVVFNTSNYNLTIYSKKTILPAYVNPSNTTFDLSLNKPARTNIFWNDASYVLKVKNLSNNSFLQDPDFDVIGDTLFINASYLFSIFTSSGQTKAFEITFDIGKDTLFITSKQSPYITPNPMVYYYEVPSELRGIISWNDASSITSIYENPSNPLVLGQHYEISVDTLIFLPSYLSARFTSNDTVDYTIIFNTDNYVLRIISTKFTNVEKYEAIVRLYPNPASEEISVEVPQEANVEIWNIVGQLIMSARVEQRSTFNISHLQEGTYFMKVNSTGFTKTLPFIIKR